MPRSKRNRVISLTKSESKGRALKTKLVESLRDATDDYKNIFTFSYENMREAKFKDVRMDWKESKIYLGKNSVAQIALGRGPEDEFKDNLRHVSEQLTGNVGLLFTNKTKKETLKYFKGFSSPEYAKAGAIATENVILHRGVTEFPVSMLDQLRKLGLVVEIDNGTVVLKVAFQVAELGLPLSPEQSKLLVHMRKTMCNFSIQMSSHWSKGEFQQLI